MMNDQLLEEMSDVCHEEWVKWSKNISKELYVIKDILKKDIDFSKEHGYENNEAKEMLEKIESRLERWESLWVPYNQLSEEMKSSDRAYAEKMLNLAENHYK